MCQALYLLCLPRECARILTSRCSKVGMTVPWDPSAASTPVQPVSISKASARMARLCFRRKAWMYSLYKAGTYTAFSTYKHMHPTHVQWMTHMQSSVHTRMYRWKSGEIVQGGFQSPAQAMPVHPARCNCNVLPTETGLPKRAL